MVALIALEISVKLYCVVIKNVQVNAILFGFSIVLLYIYLRGYRHTLYTIAISFPDGCNDSKRRCRKWKKKVWFTEWCKGRYKDSIANGYFGGKTLIETCRRSCEGCDGKYYVYDVSKYKTSSPVYF